MLDKNWDKMFGISLAGALALGCCSNWNGVQVQNRLDLEHDQSDIPHRAQTVVISEKDSVMTEKTYSMSEAEDIANEEIIENCGQDCACVEAGGVCQSDVDCCNPMLVCDTGRCEYERH